MNGYAQIYLSYILPGIFSLLTIFFLAISYRALRYRKPFLISQKWMLAIMFVGFAPSFISPFIFTHPKVPTAVNIMHWINPVLFGGILMFMWFHLRGYIAFAITEKSFREALFAGIAKLGYSHEETFSSLHLKPCDHDIQVSIQAWSGSAVLRPKCKRDEKVLDKLAQEMNLHFQERGGETNFTSILLYAFLGLIMLVTGVCMVLIHHASPMH